MINGSTAFNTAVNEGGHPYTARISENGTIINCDVISCVIVKGSTGNEAFSVGGCFVPYIQMEVRELSTPVENKELKLEVGVYTDDTNIAWIDIGYFKVTKVESSTVKTTFTGVGRIAALLALIQPTLTSPTTIASVISTVQAAVRAYSIKYSSFTINTSTVDITGGEITESLEGLNARQLLEIVAGCVGGYLTEDNAGNVVIFKYNTNSVNTYNGDRMIQHPTFSNYNYSLTNIKVVQQEAYELEDGTIIPEVSYIYDNTQPYDWVILNEYMASQAMFNKFCTNCIGLTYRPATIELAYGDPRLEATDVIKIIDNESVEYIVPGFSIIHNITGGLITTITAPGMSETEIDADNKGPITQQLDAMSSSVQTARIAAVQAQADADIVSGILADMQDAAEAAGTTLEGIYADAEAAQTSADNAAEAAEQASLDAYSATVSANGALTQLSVVENVVGVLDLLTKNGQYELTVDTEVQEGKWYFVRSGSGTQEDPYIYNAVQTPTGDPNAQGWYELIGINKAIQNYVSSHLVLDNEGLRLQSDASGTSMLLSTLRGVVLYGTNGTEIASYGSTAIIGNKLDFHIEIDNQEIGFYQGSNRVAYMNGAELYVENSLSFGNFVFQQRQNGHFTLKLI